MRVRRFYSDELVPRLMWALIIAGMVGSVVFKERPGRDWITWILSVGSGAVFSVVAWFAAKWLVDGAAEEVDE